MRKMWVVLGLAWVATSAMAQAGKPAEAGSPNELVAHAVEHVIKAAQVDPAAHDGDIDATVRVVEREFLPYTDFQRTTRLAVGPAWKTATPAQQKQLFEQFQTLLVHVYALQLTQIHDQQLSFKYSPASLTANGTDAVVRTDVTGTGDDLQVGYRLSRGPTGWKIYDIDMMGAWLVLVYRQQFGDQIARGGVDGLIKFLVQHNGRVKS